MGILDELLGGGQLQKEYKDFVDRYEQGDPSDGYSDQEVLKRYGEVSHAVPPDQFAQAAQEALNKLSPEERAAFVKMLQERAAERGVTLPREVASDPKDLGSVPDYFLYTLFSPHQASRAPRHCSAPCISPPCSVVSVPIKDKGPAPSPPRSLLPPPPPQHNPPPPLKSQIRHPSAAPPSTYHLLSPTPPHSTNQQSSPSPSRRRKEEGEKKKEK